MIALDNIEKLANIEEWMVNGRGTQIYFKPGRLPFLFFNIAKTLISFCFANKLFKTSKFTNHTKIRK